MEIIDTHIHFWNFDKAEYEWLKNDTSVLKRTYHIDEIEEDRKQVGITGGYWCRQQIILKILIGCWKLLEKTIG